MSKDLVRTGPRKRPLIMGILNVTPDSFSDGGLYDSPEAAVEHAVALVEAGADVIDVGGESTRPGAEPVDAETEQERVLPVITELVSRGIRVSVDTTRASTAAAASWALVCVGAPSFSSA
jgi:dihydropteroate synthase